MEKDTTIIFDISAAPAGSEEYTITLDCYYPADIETKKKGDLAESIVLYKRCRNLSEAKETATQLWKEYSPGAMKSLIIKHNNEHVAKSNNFDKFK